MNLTRPIPATDTGGVAVAQYCAFSASANRAMTRYDTTLITKGITDVWTDNYANAIVCKNIGEVLIPNVSSDGDFTGITKSTTFSQQNGTYYGIDSQVSGTGHPSSAPRPVRCLSSVPTNTAKPSRTVSPVWTGKESIWDRHLQRPRYSGWKCMVGLQQGYSISHVRPRVR